jgi:hypothetical protein
MLNNTLSQINSAAAVAHDVSISCGDCDAGTCCERVALCLTGGEAHFAAAVAVVKVGRTVARIAV